MKLEITRACVGAEGANLKVGDVIEAGTNLANLLIGNGQAIEVAEQSAPEPEPEPEPAPEPAPAPKKKVARKKMDKSSDEPGD